MRKPSRSSEATKEKHERNTSHMVCTTYPTSVKKQLVDPQNQLWMAAIYRCGYGSKLQSRLCLDSLDTRPTMSRALCFGVKHRCIFTLNLCPDQMG